ALAIASRSDPGPWSKVLSTVRVLGRKRSSKISSSSRGRGFELDRVVWRRLGRAQGPADRKVGRSQFKNPNMEPPWLRGRVRAVLHFLKGRPLNPPSSEALQPGKCKFLPGRRQHASTNSSDFSQGLLLEEKGGKKGSGQVLGPKPDLTLFAGC